MFATNAQPFYQEDGIKNIPQIFQGFALAEGAYVVKPC